MGEQLEARCGGPGEGLWAVVRRWPSLSASGETVAGPGISKVGGAGREEGKGQGGDSSWCPGGQTGLDRELQVEAKAVPTDGGFT